MGVFAFLSLHLELFGLDAELAPLAAGYLRAMLFGLPGMMLFVNVRGFLEGYARTRPAMLVGLLGLALNVPCNYVLIYGKLGLPRLGAVGRGVATALCYWFMGLTLALYARREARCRRLGPLFLPLCCRVRPGRAAGPGGWTGRWSGASSASACPARWPPVSRLRCSRSRPCCWRRWARWWWPGTDTP